MAVSDLPPPVGPPVLVSKPTNFRPPRRSPRRRRTAWYATLAVGGMLAAVGNAVKVSGEPPVATAITSAPAAAETTGTATTSVAAAAATTSTTSTTSTTTTSTTTVPDEPAAVPMSDVTDATGSFVVQVPDGFQTNTEPVTIGGVHLRHVSASLDIARYLAGDFSVIGATVLAGPSEAIGDPSEFVVQFDPGQACTPSDVELGASTDVGAAAVLSYEHCGEGQYTLVLVAVDIAAIHQVVFVGVQGAGSSTTATRDLAIGIVESFRQA